MADKAPPGLKTVQPYLMLAKQFTKRDPVVAYYANMYAVQQGIGAAKNDPTSKAYLVHLMDQLDKMKKDLKDEEALSNEVVAQAHIEEAGLRLFHFADTKDREGNFGRDMIKAFFTASHIFTISNQFGELSEEIEEKTKYAKWKAVEIDRCLKNGINPTPGPPGGDDDTLGQGEGGGGGAVGWNVTPPDQGLPPGAQQDFPPAERPVPKPRQQQPPPPAVMADQDNEASSYQAPAALSGATLGPEKMSKAQKLCKFAMSSLDYDDVPGAMKYLTNALQLLKTGQEPPE